MITIDLRNKNYLEILNILDEECSSNNLPLSFITEDDKKIICSTPTEVVVFSRAWNAGYVYARFSQ